MNYSNTPELFDKPDAGSKTESATRQASPSLVFSSASRLQEAGIEPTRCTGECVFWCAGSEFSCSNSPCVRCN
jgi:hypothetical protein